MRVRNILVVLSNWVEDGGIDFRRRRRASRDHMMSLLSSSAWAGCCVLFCRYLVWLRICFAGWLLAMVRVAR